jgi:hypothetical protein
MTMTRISLEGKEEGHARLRLSFLEKRGGWRRRTCAATISQSGEEESQRRKDMHVNGLHFRKQEALM